MMGLRSESPKFNGRRGRFLDAIESLIIVVIYQRKSKIGKTARDFIYQLEILK